MEWTINQIVFKQVMDDIVVWYWYDCIKTEWPVAAICIIHTGCTDSRNKCIFFKLETIIFEYIFSFHWIRVATTGARRGRGYVSGPAMFYTTMVPPVTTDGSRSTEEITSFGGSFTPPQAEPPPIGKKLTLCVFKISDRTAIVKGYGNKLLNSLSPPGDLGLKNSMLLLIKRDALL